MDQQLGLVDEWITGLVDWLYQARLGWMGLDYQRVGRTMFPSRPPSSAKATEGWGRMKTEDRGWKIEDGPAYEGRGGPGNAWRSRLRLTSTRQAGATILPPEGSGIDGVFFAHHNGQFSKSRKRERCRGDTKMLFSVFHYKFPQINVMHRKVSRKCGRGGGFNHRWTQMNTDKNKHFDANCANYHEFFQACELVAWGWQQLRSIL
jgi:hypothetical protein